MSSVALDLRTPPCIDSQDDSKNNNRDSQEFYPNNNLFCSHQKNKMNLKSIEKSAKFESMSLKNMKNCYVNFSVPKMSSELSRSVFPYCMEDD